MAESDYSITYKRSAAKALRKLDRQHQRAIISAVEELALNPRPDGVKKLQGGAGEYRIRIGSYRAVYEVNDGELVILVLALGHRREIYEKR